MTRTGLHRERNEAIFKVCAPKRGARAGLAAFNEIVKWKDGIISEVPATSCSIDLRFEAMEIVECWPPQISQKPEKRGFFQRFTR